ncbi:hypothetical protein BURMUCF1_A0783, partial [Burkholderia multivorans ATCC BAA-247]
MRRGAAGIACATGEPYAATRAQPAATGDGRPPRRRTPSSAIGLARRPVRDELALDCRRAFRRARRA